MKKSVLFVGVGGQGAILAAKILIHGVMSRGYDVKMSEVHGMSQRGGSVSTQVHFGDKVHAPVIGPGEADILVAFERMEAVRYAEYLKPDGVAVINDYAIESVSTASGQYQYPEGCVEAMEKLFDCRVLDAGAIALSLGSAKCMNVVLFGALTQVLGMEDVDWEEIIRQTVPAKFVDLNLRAYHAGREAALKTV